MSLARRERRERPDAATDDIVPAADLGLAFDDDEPGALAHLMILERLTGLEAKRDRPRAVVRREDLGIDGAAGRLELREVP